jgi:hypothetical protein
MQSSRRLFLRGLASIAGAASAQTASAQHVHPAPPPQTAALPATPPASPIPPYELGPGIVPVVSPDVPNMPWRLENGVKVFDIRVEHVRTELPRPRGGWVGIQRQHSRPDDSGHRRRSCPSHRRKPLARAVFDALARPRNPERHGWHARNLSGGDPTERSLRVRTPFEMSMNISRI